MSLLESAIFARLFETISLNFLNLGLIASINPMVRLKSVLCLDSKLHFLWKGGDTIVLKGRAAYATSGVFRAVVGVFEEETVLFRY
jgi:hypothetical protein